MTPPRPSLLVASSAALGLLLGSTGCGGLGVYETPCYDDSACENGMVCRAGECVLQCVTSAECPAAAPVCQFNRCIPGPAPGDAGLLPDALPLGDTSPGTTPDAASALPDAPSALPDAASALPDAPSALPDAASVLPDAASTPSDAGPGATDAGSALPDATPTPDAL